MLMHLLAFLHFAEVASECNHRASHLGSVVHPAGLPALCCAAYFCIPGGGEVESSRVGLLCGHHVNDGGLWRLRGRYAMLT